jgi:hypothetical protein
MPIWREDEGGRPISLIITRAGRDAVGLWMMQARLSRRLSSPAAVQRLQMRSVWRWVASLGPAAVYTRQAMPHSGSAQEQTLGLR